MAPVTIPQFLLPRGIPSTRAFQSLSRANATHHRIRTTTRRCASDNSKPRVLEQPDKFRPPSHPARRVVQTRNGRVVGREPVNYGPKLTEKEREEQNRKQYPNMFPPEGTVMYKFLTNRWIHIWIAMVSFFSSRLWGLLWWFNTCPGANWVWLFRAYLRLWLRLLSLRTLSARRRLRTCFRLGRIFFGTPLIPFLRRCLFSACMCSIPPCRRGRSGISGSRMRRRDGSTGLLMGWRSRLKSRARLRLRWLMISLR